MSLLETVLHALANPTVIGFLLAIAIPAILIELQSPGGWVAGFVGVVSLVLALYGLGQLPVNWFGLALIVVAFVLLLMEAAAPSFGGLGIAGAVTLVAGMLVLFNANDPPEFARLSIANAIAISLPSALFFLYIAGLAVRTQRQQPKTGKEGLVGAKGQVRTALSPQGTILVHGEIWRAEASESVESGARVVVEDVDGFTLKVRREGPPPSA
jgi:membrane-bound serine protease (ClpP class)